MFEQHCGIIEVLYHVFIPLLLSAITHIPLFNLYSIFHVVSVFYLRQGESLRIATPKFELPLTTHVHCTQFRWYMLLHYLFELITALLDPTPSVFIFL